MKTERKKLLFVCYGLGIGGIEKCLVNLLNALPENQFDVDLLLMNPEYSYVPQLRRKVNFLDSFSYVMNIADTPREIRARGGFLKNIPKTLSYCKFRLLIKAKKNAWTVFSPLPTQYDIAIAYSQNDYSPYYVMDKVQAKRKVMWYHNGAYERDGQKFERDKAYYKKFDYVVAVSNDCRAMLQKKFNFSEKQLIVLRNICDASEVRAQADAFIPETFSETTYHIVTVGRLTKEKGADLVLDCCQILLEHGKQFMWHWVGDGNMRPEIEQKIAEMGLQACLCLEGSQPNPYPYIKQADLYVQPSYYEAYSTTVTEAKILAKPMIVTDVGGMRDQLSDTVNGMIVPISAEKIADAILRVMNAPELEAQFRATLEKERFDAQKYLEAYSQTVLRGE